MTTLDFHIKPEGENAFGLEAFRRDSSQPLATVAIIETIRVDHDEAAVRTGPLFSANWPRHPHPT